MKRENQTLQIEITIAPANGHRGGRRRRAVPEATDPPRIPRIARLMALAIKFQNTIDRGEFRDYADLARLGYVSRARITQIMNLLLLAPDLQEIVLFASNENSVPAERELRSIIRPIDWPTQRTGFHSFQHLSAGGK